MSCTPHLSKYTLFYHAFCCTSLKLWHLQMLFSFFQNFGFLSYYNEMGWGGGGWKGKELSKMTKQICLTLHLRNCTSYDCGFWYTCVKWWYLQQHLFSFFQNSDFSGFSKFINKCRKEILRFAPPSSHVCHFFLYLYSTLSEISYAILCCLPTGKIATFPPTKFDFKCFIFL